MSAAAQRDERCLDPDSEIRMFEAGNIIVGQFDHAAHVRIAWLYLQRFSTAEAIERFTTALRALTIRLGAADKYHETITWFFMLVIADRRACKPSAGWDEFRSVNSDLFEQGSGLLKQHYSPARLASAEARQRFLLPDLAPGQALSTGPGTTLEQP